MWPIVVKYGSAAGGIAVLVLLSAFMLGGVDSARFVLREPLGIALLFLSMVAIPLGLFRWQLFAKGNLYAWQLFLGGVAMSLVASLITGIYTLALYEWADPGFMQWYRTTEMAPLAQQQDLSPDIRAEALARIANESPMLFDVTGQTLSIAIAVLGWGTLISIFSALLLKKDAQRS